MSQEKEKRRELWQTPPARHPASRLTQELGSCCVTGFCLTGIGLMIFSCPSSNWLSALKKELTLGVGCVVFGSFIAISAIPASVVEPVEQRIVKSGLGAMPGLLFVCFKSPPASQAQSFHPSKRSLTMSSASTSQPRSAPFPQASSENFQSSRKLPASQPTICPSRPSFALSS